MPVPHCPMRLRDGGEGLSPTADEAGKTVTGPHAVCRSNGAVQGSGAYGVTPAMDIMMSISRDLLSAPSRDRMAFEDAVLS